MMRRLVIGVVLALVSICSLHAQSVTPAAPGNPIKAIYTPQPVYQAEWVKRGLTGKGVVLVTIDKETGKVTGAQMLQSTGSKELDGSALEAYSRWRFRLVPYRNLRFQLNSGTAQTRKRLSERHRSRQSSILCSFSWVLAR